jgi:DNA replication and repair protein RecF
MRFLNLRLQNFRNIEFAELPLANARNFLLGANGQGSLICWKHSGWRLHFGLFARKRWRHSPAKGLKEYKLAYELEHDTQGSTTLEIHSHSKGRSVWVDGEKVTRLVEFIGRFPSVTLCSSDLMLLRGSPSERRRFMDLALSVVNRDYYTALRDFHRGIAERNRLLKNSGSTAELSAFEAEIAPHASQIASYREAGMRSLSEVLCRTYDRIAEADEGPELSFRPNVDCHDTEAYCRLLHESRKRDQMIGATQRGPHRDDFNFSLQVGVLASMLRTDNSEVSAWLYELHKLVFTANSLGSSLSCWRTMCSASSTRSAAKAFGAPAPKMFRLWPRGRSYLQSGQVVDLRSVEWPD